MRSLRLTNATAVQLSLIADKVLMAGVQVEGARKHGKESHEVRLSRDDKLNEDQFIVSVLVAEGLVNERMVKVIRSKYHEMIDEHNKVVPPTGLGTHEGTALP